MKKSDNKSSKSKSERPVFSAIRKPQAPPGHPLSQAKPEERAHPAGRKAKHKQRPSTSDGDE
ncbi:MAG TPA: hypothetical protein VJS44_01955 [Pyrinomonadaceae bacterium]|nr:hypothetical protein [Pyrinomonadaceae bacterium]